MAKKRTPQKKDAIARVLLIGLASLIGIVGLAFCLATKDSTLIKTVLFCVLTIILFLILLVSDLFKGEIRIPRSKMMLPLGLYLCFSITSLVFWRYRYAGLKEFVYLLCCVMLFFIAMRAVATRQAFLTLMAAVALVALLSCLYAIPRHYGHDVLFGGRVPLPDEGRSFSTMGHPNFWGTFLILSLPILLSFFTWAERSGLKILAAGLICLVQLCLLYTESRGAWLGLLGALPIWFFLSLGSPRWRKILLVPILLAAGFMVALLFVEGARGYVILWALPFWLLAMLLLQSTRSQENVSFEGKPVWSAILLFAVAIVSNALVDPGKIGGRMEAAFEAEKGSVLARKVIWTGTLKMAAARPIFGWGTGRFSIHFPRFRDPATAGRIMPNTLHAHSEFLETAAEMGIVGLGLFLWMLGALLWEGVRNGVQSKDSFQRRALAALVAGYVAILLHGTVSVTTRWIVGRFFLWLSMGLIIVLPSVKHSIHSGGRKNRGDRNAADEDEEVSRITFRPLRMPLLRFAVVLLAAALTFAAGWWARRIWLSAVLTRQAEGYQIASESIQVQGSSAREIVSSRNTMRLLRQKAISFFERALDLNPYNLFAYYKLGHTYNLQGELEQSLRTYLRMSSLAPDSSDIHLNLGVVYANMGRWENSRKEYETALSMKIGPLTRLGTARAYENLQRFKDAEEQYAALLKTDPDDVRAINGLAGLSLRRGENRAALELYDKALAVDPENADSLLGMGLINQMLGQVSRTRGDDAAAQQYYQKSILQLQGAMKNKPDSLPIRAALALVFADAERFDEALALLRTGFEIRPDDPLLHLNLGKVHLRRNAMDLAREEFQRTRQIDPRGPWGAEAARELNSLPLNRQPDDTLNEL